MVPLALAPTFVISMIHTLERIKRNKLDKLSFLNIYNGRECIVIFQNNIT